MTTRFQNRRIGFYIFTFALTGVILGLAANFATTFLPDYRRDFTIFSLVAPSLTILIFMLQIQWAQPQTEVVSLTILSVIWLTEAAWSNDIIGTIQCDSLKGQTIPSKNNGHTGFQPYCYKMKTIQALSWALFIAFLIALFVIVKLVSHARRWGRFHIWSEPISEMCWFGEIPGQESGQQHNMYAQPGVYSSSAVYPSSLYPSPAVYQAPNVYQPPTVHQPGAIYIQPGVNGAPPIIGQIPHMQTQAA